MILPPLCCAVKTLSGMYVYPVHLDKARKARKSSATMMARKLLKNFYGKEELKNLGSLLRCDQAIVNAVLGKHDFTDQLYIHIWVDKTAACLKSAPKMKTLFHTFLQLLSKLVSSG